MKGVIDVSAAYYVMLHVICLDINFLDGGTFSVKVKVSIERNSSI